jgi:hypothetical protein
MRQHPKKPVALLKSAVKRTEAVPVMGQAV